MVGVPMPSRRFPVTWRSRYRASRGGGPAQQQGQQLQFEALRTRPFRVGDLAQRVHHHDDRQAVDRAGGRHRGQQLLARQAQVPDLPYPGRDLVVIDAGRGGDRADGHLLGQAEVYPGELRRDQALAQVAHHGQQPVGRLGQQRGQPLDQRQPPGGLLQVPVRLGHDQIPHGAPFLISDHGTPLPEARTTAVQKKNSIYAERAVVHPPVTVLRPVVRMDQVGGAKFTEPPLLIVEIRSPSTTLVDLNRKKAAYERFGVPSY